MRCRGVLPVVILGLLTVSQAEGQAPAFLVKDINPGQPEPVVFRPEDEGEGVGGLYYFVTDDGTHGSEKNARPEYIAQAGVAFLRRSHCLSLCW